METYIVINKIRAAKALLSAAAFFMGVSALTHAQTVIDMHGRTINSNLNYGWTENPAQYLFYDSTLATGRTLTFDSARFTGANFNKFTISSGATMRMQTWGEFVGSMNNFTNMNIYGTLDISGIGSFSNVSFSGTKVYGTFSIDSLNGAVTSGNVLFENMLFDVNSRFFLSSGNFTSGASFNGTEVRGNFTLGTGNYSNIKMTNMLFTGTSVFNMNAADGIIAEGADFSGSRFLGSVKISASMNAADGSNPSRFDNITVGKDFTLDTGNYRGISFRGAIFNEDSVFTIASSGSGGVGAIGADFSGASFKGRTVMNADLSGAKFDSAKFIGTSSIQSVNNASFANAEFSGTTEITNASQVNFSDAKFKAGSITTFNNSMTGATFLRTRFESGSNVKMASTDLSGAEFDGILIQNGAVLYMDSAAEGIRLANSAIDAGGRLTVSSDGWGRNWSNAVIENNNFAGDVFFGVTEQDNRDYNSLNMTGASFAGTSFGGNADFRWVNMNGASFKNSDLGGTVNFTGKIGPYKERIAGNFALANFNGAALGGTVTFTDMLMNNATFDGAQFGGDVTFRTVNLDGNGFGTNLTGADFRSSGAVATNITGNLLFDGVLLKDARFDGVNFSSGKGSSPSAKTVFLNSTMSGASFAGANFDGSTDFVGGWLLQAKFGGASFGGTTNFDGVNMNLADFSSAGKATFSGDTSFKGATLTSANFAGADFIAAGSNSTLFSNSTMTSANFARANFGGNTVFSGGSLQQAKFGGSVFGGNTNFENINMGSADFSTAGATVFSGNTVFSNAALGSANFSGANFSAAGANQTLFANSVMTSAKFVGAKLGGNVNFNDSNMGLASFKGAELGGAIGFLRTDLAGSVFEDAMLTGNVSFKGAKSGGTQISGKMGNANLKGAYLGSGVSFTDMNLDGSTFAVSSSGKAAVLDGVVFTNTGLAGVDFSGATIMGNTTFQNWTWLQDSTFRNTKFESSGDTKVVFADANLQDVSFEGASFEGGVVFSRSHADESYYDGADFSGADFKAGSSVTFDGGGGSLGAMVFAGNQNFNGGLLFNNIDLNRFSFENAKFGASSRTSFTNADLGGASFGGMVLKGGGVFSVDGSSNVDGASFAGAEFEANSVFNFYDTNSGAVAALSFSGAKFRGDTNFASDSRSTSLSGADFGGAEFFYDASRDRPMFNMQNTGITWRQLSQTANFQNGRLDFRGMNLSGNAARDPEFNGNDWRGALMDSAVLGGFYGNDFRGGTANAQTNYGESFISVDGKLGGLNKHTSSNHNVFKIRSPNSGGSSAVYLQADSTRLNSGVTLIIGSGNEIFADGSDRGLSVEGTIEMDSGSVFHMTNGASMDWADGGLLDITISAGENYIVIGDYDDFSSITMSTIYDWTTGNLIVRGDSEDREWRLEVFDENNQLVLYYAVPEPAAYAALLGCAILAFAMVVRRRSGAAQSR